jgi:hypothetical protein
MINLLSRDDAAQRLIITQKLLDNARIRVLSSGRCG